MVKLISLLKKLPGRTHEEFAAYWTGPHADLDKKMPRLKKYVINVLNTEQMTTFLNQLQADAASELGITLPTPQDRFWEAFYQDYR